MLSEECISGFFPIGLRTKSGLLWFPTQEGIVVADPHHQTTDIPAPAVVLEETLVDGVPDAADSIAPGARQAPARISIHGLNFDAPERVRFRYRLEGTGFRLGGSRIEPLGFLSLCAARRIPISRSSPATAKGLEHTGASVAVTVQPYLWQTWWFQVPASLGLLAAWRSPRG
jgi:hypothetical protein